MDSSLSVGISKVINGNISDYDPRHSLKKQMGVTFGWVQGEVRGQSTAIRCCMKRS